MPTPDIVTPQHNATWCSRSRRSGQPTSWVVRRRSRASAFSTSPAGRAWSRLAARTMGAGHVVGLDINAAMLAAARSQPACPVPPIDGARPAPCRFPDRSFDPVLCQLGLQFFPDRSRALREMLRVLVPHGRLALGMYAAIERTPVAKRWRTPSIGT